MNLKEKKAAILGLGIEGIALYEFLRDKVAKLTLCDKRSEEELLSESDEKLLPKIKEALSDSSITKSLGNDYMSGLENFDIVFRSPSIYFNDPVLVAAKRKGIVVSSQMQLFFDLAPCMIIGVTGTKGKGTTASLMYEILKKSYQPNNPELQTPSSQPLVYLAGNIGYPAITLIPNLSKYDIVILELSNFQLADLTKSPHIAVVTNLGVDHLDYHKNEEEYHAAKRSIVLFQSQSDHAVLNFNSTFQKEVLDRVKSRLHYFSKDNPYVEGAVLKDERGFFMQLKSHGKEFEICHEKDIKLLGKHNLENIAAAAIVADILGVEIKTMREAIRNFAGLPHRLEKAGVIDKVLYINDSFATNPGPTMAAIDSFSEDKIIILGGSPKGADFSELALAIKSSSVKAVILIGEEGPRIKNALLSAGYRGNIIKGSSDIDAIVEQAQAEASRGDVILFSPACASFDMFKNYKDRGEKFKEAVAKLSRR